MDFFSELGDDTKFDLGVQTGGMSHLSSISS